MGTKREKLEHFLENKKNWNIVLKKEDRALYEQFRIEDNNNLLIGESSHVGPPAPTPSATATSSVTSAASAATSPLKVSSFRAVIVERGANLMVLVGL